MVSVEPISLSTSAIALASLFSTCIDCFDYVESVKSYGRDFELMSTKLKTQKTRLLLWGQSAGFTASEGLIGRVWWWQSPLCRPVIERILQCIHVLLEDTHRLQVRYVIKQLKDAKGQSIRKTALHRFSMFRVRMGNRQDQTSIVRKALWAIHDKAKFENLINDIRQFVDGLE